MPATEPDSCSVVTHNLQPDSKNHSSHDVAVGRLTSRACRRDQSMPSTNAASCADVSRITPSVTGGHRNAFCSSRFHNSTRPEPSHATIFILSARFERNTKSVPENGSCPSVSRTSATSPSAPRRKSTGLVATITCIPAGTAIMLPPSRPAGHRATSQRRRRGRRVPPHPRARSQSTRHGALMLQRRRARTSRSRLARTAATPWRAGPDGQHAQPCAMQTDAVVRCRAVALPPTPQRQAHRIPPLPGPWPRRSIDAGVRHRHGYRCGRAAPKRQLYAQPYMRTDPQVTAHICRFSAAAARWG